MLVKCYFRFISHILYIRYILFLLQFIFDILNLYFSFQIFVRYFWFITDGNFSENTEYIKIIKENKKHFSSFICSFLHPTCHRLYNR